MVAPASRHAVSFERPISDYGVIGDGRSAALVSSAGAMDWWCPGRFDAPSVFAALLDVRRGGTFQLAPVANAATRARYLPATNVLETEFRTSEGRARLTDCAVFPEDAGVPDAVIVRRLDGLAGCVEMEARFEPRFQYGRVPPRWATAARGLVARGAGEAILLDAPPTTRGEGRPARFLLEAGDALDLIVRHAPFDALSVFDPPLALPPEKLIEATKRRWRARSDATLVRGPHEEPTRRAFLVTDLLRFATTGAVAGAPTTSLPQEIGGVRNWDQRHACVRDAAWAVRALLAAGRVEDARGTAAWLLEVVRDDAPNVRAAYSVGGSPSLPEREVAHLDGRRRSRPVRVGNRLWADRPLHACADVLCVAAEVDRLDVRDPSWAVLSTMADRIADHWREPDDGLWGVWSAPRQHVLGAAHACVALERAAAAAARGGLPAEARRWGAAAREARADVDARGSDGREGPFRQALGGGALDAGNLLLPLIGFVDARDPRMVATVDATLARLTRAGLVARDEGLDDGLPGGGPSLTACTCWLAEVLALQGRLSEARLLIDGVLARATPLGLLGEGIEPETGEPLGNFPHALTELSLASAALTLETATRAPSAEPSGASAKGAGA